MDAEAATAAATATASATPAPLPPTFHLHGHPLPACKPLDILFRPAGWPQGLREDDHHNEQDTTLDLFLLSLSRPVLVFAHPALTTPRRSSSSSGSGLVAGDNGSPHRDRDRDRDPTQDSFSVSTSVEATLRTLSQSLTHLRRQEPDLEVFGMMASAAAAAAAAARAGTAAAPDSSPPSGLVVQELGRRLGLTFPLLGDVDLSFSRSLDLPETSRATSASTSGPKASTPLADLSPLLLLFREGQVVRVEQKLAVGGPSQSEHPTIPHTEEVLLQQVLLMLE
ncbi:unnamed protein product [Parajaminaea phylloscopi]